MQLKSKTKVFLTCLIFVALFGCAALQKTRDGARAAGDIVGEAANISKDADKVKEATTPTVVDKYEPNDDLLNPTEIELNSTVKSTIEPAKDIDVFKVHIKSNKREVVKVTFDNPATNITPHLTFYNENREKIGSVDEQQKGAASVSGQFIAQPNQDYYIKTYSGKWDGDPDNERSGKYYELEVKLASVSDEYEPNESLTEAAKISFGKIEGTINPAKDVDCYKIQAEKESRIKVTFDNPTLNLTPHFIFYNQNREKIGSVDGQEKGAAKVSGEFDAKADNEYYIKVFSGKWGDDPNDESSTKYYKLKVETIK